MEIDVVGEPGIRTSQPAIPKPSSQGEELLEKEAELDRSRLAASKNAAEDEEDVCRICRTPGDDESPLYYPCACSGSIKYVHQDCLLQWLNHSNARQCEVCKHAFSFSPVYAENAPSRLPFQELLLGLVMKAARGVRFFCRLTFVLSVWLLFIPFTTFWIWRFTFVRSFNEAHKLFISRFTPGLLLTDCLHGFLLSAGIVFIFLGATSLREYFRHLRELDPPVDRGDEGVDRQRPGRQAGRDAHGVVGRGAPAVDVHEPLLQPGAGAVVNADGPGGQGIAAGAGQLIRRNAENVAARLEMQAARLEAHVEQMFDAVEDADGAEDVPFDELVGMQGPVFHLIENAITVLASNAIFLALVALLPFTIGRVVLSLFSRVVVATYSPNGMIASNITSIMSTGKVPLANMSSILAAKSMLFDIMSSNTTIENVVSGGAAFGGVTSALSTKGMSNKVTEAMVAALRLSDAATVAVGYGFILVVLSVYLGLIALIRYSRGEPITVGRIHGVATMAEAAPSVARQVMAGVKYMATMVKVAFLLIIELGVFPLMCGWWLDICTLGMLDVSIAQRVEFFWSSPLTSSLLHWLVGIVYMLQISVFVSLLREVLRPGVLYFLRDPTDPNYNPFRDLIDDPLHKHARRVLLSVVVYGSLIVMLVFLPVRLAILASPTMFPLDIRVSDPFTEIPADMLLFHICIPFAVEHFRPRATIKAALYHWFSAVGWALGLCEYLLPGPEETNVNNNGQEQARVQQGQLDAPDQNQAIAPAERGEQEEQLENPAIGDDYEVDDEASADEYKFVLRIVLLLFSAWITLLAFNSAMVLLPVSLGRGIFSLFSQLPIARGAKCNDLYAFNIGCYVLWATAAAVRYVVDYLRTHDVHVLLMQVLKWSAIVAKSFVLLTLWIIAIPVLIGLLFELLVVVPMRVAIDESPVFIYYQDWALGLVFLKIWTRLVMLGQITPLADESWRIKFEQVRADGFANLRGFWVLKEIIFPILLKLMTALLVPYVFAHWIFPCLGYSLIVNSAVNRYAWQGCLALGLLWYGMKRLRQWLLDLHNSIRDDRYLVGRRLHNFGERRRSGTPTSPKVEAAARPVARFPGPVVEDVARLGGPTDQDSPNTVLNSASAGSSSGVVEEKNKYMPGESRDVLIRAAIQEGERLGMAGASLRFRHSTTGTSSTNSDQ
ncbi:E3 ubiquitin-protein ligase MARCH6 [Marchantia polymorpha subsp. ruderalis]|uniref:RING-type E3 ubiquitin transferase n=1 Tax=Marchantia polymorpha TaxID=3197 RepID=A0A2R6WK04_MARPO|nr:hypothetical protein MARPO_0082s0015 [Marchantia polymorpha]BBN02416.1 hypothetical protein Mp_2g15190 [Marchantia polymorpha subsp. ruderalis]|eukprot:PTQ34159.1 hypothetical protein MARPO_0082s0015 [Marchantia polymorpha]